MSTPRERRFRRVFSLAAGIAAVLLAAFVLLIAVKPARRPPPGRSAGEIAGTVTVESAEVKSEPSAGSASAGSLARGARVTVIEDRGRWLKVRAEKDRVGFLPSDAVETDAERETRQRRASKILSFAPVPGVVAAEADILLAPFPAAARAGKLRPGTTIPIHGVDHAYYAFRQPDGGLAFVNSADVDLVPPDPRRPEIVPESGRTLKDVAVQDISREPTPPVGSEGREAGGNLRNPVLSGDEARRGEPVEPALLLSKVDPPYPDAARRAGVEGTVELDILIGTDGRVADVQVMRGLPLGVSEAAVDAVRRWVYRPARSRSGPVASAKTVRIVFQLNE